MSYFVGVIVSSMWLILSVFDISFVYTCNSHASNMFVPAKLFTNEFLDLPMTLSKYWQQNRELKNDLQKIKMENDSLKIILTTTTDLKNELNELKKSIDFRYTLSNYKVVEKVLGFDNGIYESFMIISATHEEVLPGSVVISSNGLVGVIYDRHNSVARVMHVFDQKINIPVVSQSGDHMILGGNGKNDMFSREISSPIDSSSLKSKENEILITSGEGGVFPYGIPVARITEIKDNFVKAAPIHHLDNIAFVWILQPIIGGENNKTSEKNPSN